HSENSGCVCAERHANPELLRALVDGETHHAIKTDGRKNECDDSKNGEQCRDDAVAGENFIVKSSRRSCKISRQIRIELGHRSAQSRAKSVSTLARPRTSKDRQKLRSRRCAEQWHVKAHAVRLL